MGFNKLLNKEWDCSEPQSKVAVILPSAAGGGAERTLLKIAANFNRERIAPYFILIDPTGPCYSLLPPDIPLHTIGVRRVSRSALKLLILLRTIRPHVVLSSIYHLNLMLLMLKPFLPRSTKLIIRESNMTTRSLPYGGRGALFIKRLIRWFYPHADGIICLGEEMRRELVKSFHIPQELIDIIPNPVDRNEIERSFNSKKNPLPVGKCNILGAGSLTTQKGFDLLLKSLYIVQKDIPNIHLTIIGEGPLRCELERMLRVLNLTEHVTLAGYCKNPYPYFKYSDLFVLSSRFEGLPNVVLEAVACGTPVVAFDCPGCVRDILVSSDQGQLVPAGDVQVLAKAIVEKLSEKRDDRKHQSLPPQFELSYVMKAYHSLIEKVAGSADSQ